VGQVEIPAVMQPVGCCWSSSAMTTSFPRPPAPTPPREQDLKQPVILLPLPLQGNNSRRPKNTQMQQ
jgi:hypothetical protein